ncbi:uncharacterized protein I303_106226 [Kwoniella dejecticola CBS 10117]|uniref:Uncharacterized protein n=1 Tax=Kwoniella dejecticola CBS 10117 TaxID=1296121 RepID=A0A1A6A1M0_9TREE|nr:uncharacterized protein I303_06245 [Kwoniella dejecticola CBS 10117]OBR83958.1 hypothetical protein I303_06245 [Kwoniella dejecticola CBS 10117]
MPADPERTASEPLNHLQALPAVELRTAHQQWFSSLTVLMDQLNQARSFAMDFDMGGTSMETSDVEPLEAKIQQTKEEICKLESEMRRRSRGGWPLWSSTSVEKIAKTSCL